MTGGKPIRFLAMVVGGWAALRAFALLPAADPMAVVEELVGVPPAAAVAPGLPPPRRIAAPAPRPIDMIVRVSAPAPAPRNASAGPAAIPGTTVSIPSTLPVTDGEPQLPPPLVPTPIAPAPSRFAGSAWLIARGSGSGTALSTSQLGASQAGARFTYALGTARRVALSARIAAPLEGRGAEAGFGLDWRPTKAPIHLIVEQRLALDGGRGGPAALIVGGIGPIEPVRGIRVEAYGQAGVIHRDRTEAFADGAARVTHRMIEVGAIRFDLGAGAWGGAQRGASRLDIGPTVGTSLSRVRLNIDWRQRIAGDARPGSGPTLSLGTDF